MTCHRAYAKINLGLRVLRKRSDGFHDIETVLHRFDLYDEIRFEPARSLEIVCTDPSIPTDDTNICHKAARLLQSHLKVTRGVRISITKHIPVGAGLGGGSSDAATVLRHLPRFWNQMVDGNILGSLAPSLGSDVSYFLTRGTALARGRGEILEYFPLDLPFGVLLCYPAIHVSSTWAYQNHRIHPSTSTDLRTVVIDALKDPPTLRKTLVNDFEELVLGTYPEIREVKEKMLASGAVYASLSGSGSSVYGFFENRETAQTAEADLRRKGYRVFWTEPHFVMG